MAVVICDSYLSQMWMAGVSRADMKERLGIGYTAINSRVKKLGLPSRGIGGDRRAQRADDAPMIEPPRKSRSLSRPKTDPVPAPEPVHHPNLFAAIKRAKAERRPIAALNAVATSYRLKYRDVLEMAGVTV